MGISDFLRKKESIRKEAPKASNEWGNKKTSKTTEEKAPVAKTPTPLPTEYDDLDYNQTRALYEFKPATLTGGDVVFRGMLGLDKNDVTDERDLRFYIKSSYGFEKLKNDKDVKKFVGKTDFPYGEEEPLPIWLKKGLPNSHNKYKLYDYVIDNSESIKNELAAMILEKYMYHLQIAQNGVVDEKKIEEEIKSLTPEEIKKRSNAAMEYLKTNIPSNEFNALMSVLDKFERLEKEILDYKKEKYQKIVEEISKEIYAPFKDKEALKNIDVKKLYENLEKLKGILNEGGDDEDLLGLIKKTPSLPFDMKKELSNYFYALKNYGVNISVKIFPKNTKSILVDFS